MPNPLRNLAGLFIELKGGARGWGWSTAWPMKHCDSCGGELDQTDPFAVCPRCLFGTALDTRARPRVIGETSSNEMLLKRGLLGRLFKRRDFFERYEILERVGGGGQGDIWRVWDHELRRCVAMKRLAEQGSGSEAAVYRFLAEAQIASQLEHPGILPIFDLGLDADDRPFYTTQLLPGTTLGDVLKKRREGGLEGRPQRALEMVLRVCEVMAHAHSRGVVHRDLKPTNVLVGEFGEVRVIDWGSAHIMEAARADFADRLVALDQELVQTDRGDAMWGTLGSPLATASAGQPITVLFMPPEILAGEKEECGPQTDVYSLGVILFELLTGRLPYARPDGSLPEQAELRRLILAGPPAAVRSLNPRVSRDLAAICEQAMAHKKVNRYPTMQMLADEIHAALELRPVQARRPGPVLKAQRFAQRNAGYVLLVCVIAVVVAVGFAVSGRLRRQRDVALQVQALRDGELEARNGHWREALRHWDEAEAAGYNDSVSLGLQRAEAWTVLNETDRSAAELNKLMRRSDLGSRRGVVLLRTGEHELFDKPTAAGGAEHVRQALRTGLDGADRYLAQGLLAESATYALALLQQALRLDPYSHAAHRHSLGLEFLLGHHEELATHIRIFEILYPDDPSPRYLEAADYALNGRLQEANATLAPVQKSMDPAAWVQVVSALRLMAEAAQYYSVDAMLNGGAFDSKKLAQLMADANCALAADPSGGVTGAARVREPHLPCVEHGILDGVAAVQALSVPFFKDITPAIQKIKSSWEIYPEALVPFRAATILETRQPRTGPKSTPLLAIQAELFQMAADSPSVMPSMQRSSRYLAAKAQSELIRDEPAPSAEVRRLCLQNIRAAMGAPETSAAECRAYFAIAFQLGDYDMAHQLLHRWEKLAPNDTALPHQRIELEITAGNFAAALRLIDGVVARAPSDPWALDGQEVVLEKLGTLINSVPPRNKALESPTTVK